MFDLSQFKNIFVSEVEDNVQKLNAGLLTLEKDFSNKDLLNDLMRYAHSTKGIAATMGFTQMAGMTHVMEDVFDFARNDKLQLTSEIIDIIFAALDKIEESIISIKESNVEINLDEESENLKKITGVNTVEMEKANEDGSSANPTQKDKKKTVGIDKSDYIKVPVKRLDTLLDLTEELIIEKMNFEEINSEFAEKGNKKSDKLGNAVNRLNRLVTEMQHHVIQVRLVPLDQVFLRFPRMVRDLAKTQNKKIDFEVSGGETELDRSIIDAMGEPILHLLRNAIDHGIMEEGKIKITASREKGFARISLCDNGNGIDFEKLIQSSLKSGVISEKNVELLKKAIPKEKNILVPHVFETLLCHPKVSTSDKITEISGRGIGLNVVKKFIEDAGGNMTIEILDPGTCFHIQLPFSLAIINAMLVNVEESTFAIPLSSIERSVILREDDVKSVLNKEMVVVDNVDVHLFRLNEVLNIKKTTDEDRKATGKNKIIVLSRIKNDLMGLVVDELLREQEIIVKPITYLIGKVKGFSGVTILGNGKTVPILDILGLLTNSNNTLNLIENEST